MGSILNKEFKLLNNKYTALKYYQSRMCSCVAENNGRPSADCSCNSGYYYKDPETFEALKVDVTYKYQHIQAGIMHEGVCQLTIPKQINNIEQTIHTTLAQGDIIVDPSKTRRDRDVLTKGMRDTIYAFDITKILSVYAKDKEFIENIDFTVSLINSSAGSITKIIWDSEADILEGDSYTVEFVSQEQYFVWNDGGNKRGATDFNMPRKVLCVLRRYRPTDNPEDKTSPLDNVDIS